MSMPYKFGCLATVAALALLAQSALAGTFHVRPGQHLPDLRSLAYRSGANGAPPDFTFNVPVRATYQTPGSEIAVGCEVGSGPATPFGFQGIAGGYTIVRTQSDGSYSGIVTISFSVGRSHNPAQANDYLCYAMPGSSDTASVTGTTAYGPLTALNVPSLRRR